jgi:dCMP deaminase
MNAIIHAARSEMAEGTLYLVGIEVESGEYVKDAEPCKLCKRAIINAGLKYVYVKRSTEEVIKFVVENWQVSENLGNKAGEKEGY